MDVPAAVTEGLRRTLLDVRTAQADAAGQLSDEELLARADLPPLNITTFRKKIAGGAN
jgi:hypothetical protein